MSALPTGWGSYAGTQDRSESETSESLFGQLNDADGLGMPGLCADDLRLPESMHSSPLDALDRDGWGFEFPNNLGTPPGAICGTQEAPPPELPAGGGCFPQIELPEMLVYEPPAAHQPVQIDFNNC